MSAWTADPVLPIEQAEVVREVVRALVQARRERRACDASALRGELRDAAQAYAVQRGVADALQESAAGFPRYWKSGGPSREATPTHAPLPAKGAWPSPANATDWPCNLRLIEIEIALRLGHDVSAKEAADLSHHEAMACVDAMTVSIELVDSRWTQGMQAPALLKLADLQSHGALVLGEWIPFAAQDWSAQRACVRIGDAAPLEYRGTHAMGDPAFVLPAWLRHVTRDGETAPRGTVVTTGTWCGMLPAAAGDLVSVRFDGIGKASLQL